MKVLKFKESTTIEYGRLNGNDRDRVLILKDGDVPKEYLPSWPDDTWETTANELLRMLAQRHPAATEPILTGSVSSGEIALISSLKDWLTTTVVPQRAIRHLELWSLWNIRSVDGFIQQYEQTQNNSLLLMALGNATYEISCAMFADYYKSYPHGCVTLQQVLDWNPTDGSRFKCVRDFQKLTQREVFRGDDIPSLEAVIDVTEYAKSTSLCILQSQ